MDIKEVVELTLTKAIAELKETLDVLPTPVQIDDAFSILNGLMQDPAMISRIVLDVESKRKKFPIQYGADGGINW